MSHPLIRSIQTIADPIAEQLDLKIVNISFQTNMSPANLRIDIENLSGDTSLDNCEKMSRQLEETLDQQGVIPSAYNLEISTPGISSVLTSDREFTSFKGFPVIVETNTVYKKKTQWQGTLHGRDEKSVYVNAKGKITSIPRDIIAKVELTS